MQVRDPTTGQWIEVVQILGGGTGGSSSSTDMAPTNNLLTEIDTNTEIIPQLKVSIDKLLAWNKAEITVMPIVNVNTTGSIPVGCERVTIANTGNAVGLVQGVSLYPDSTIILGGTSGVLPAITYDGTGTLLQIIYEKRQVI